MTAFEDFVSIELPQRPVLIKGATDATGDPNTSVIPKVVNAPMGTYYLQDDVDPKQLWQRNAPPPSGVWLPIAPTVAPPNDFYVDVNSTQTFENGSEIFPYKSMTTPLAQWGRPVDLADAQTPKRLFVSGGTYTDDLTIYAGRRIYIEVFGLVFMFGNSVTVEVDGTKDYDQGTTLSITETESVFSGNITSIFAALNISGTEVSPTAASGISLTFRKVLNLLQMDFTAITKPVIIAAESCQLKDVTGSLVDFRALRESFLQGSWSIKQALIYDCGFEQNISSFAVVLVASAFLYVRGTWNVPGITLTAPDVILDRFTYDAGIADGSLTIGTPGSVTMIDPPEIENQLWVDSNYAGPYSNGSEFYPYTSMLTALEAWGRPVDATDAATPEYMYVLGGTYSDGFTIYAGRKIYIRFLGRVLLLETITVEIDGAVDFGQTTTLSISDNADSSAVIDTAVMFYAISIIDNEVSPSSTGTGAILNLRKFTSLSSITFSEATLTVNAYAKNCMLKNVTGTNFQFVYLDASYLVGTNNFLRAWIYNWFDDFDHSSHASDITATELISMVNSFNIAGITITTPDLTIDRYSYDAGIENESLTIGTPGSVTMIDPPIVDTELYVSANYTEDYSNGSKEYPFKTIQAALDEAGIPTDLADELQEYRIIVKGDMDTVDYAENIIIPANRKVVLEADGLAKTTSITINIDGTTQFSDFSFFGLNARYSLDLSNNIVSQFISGNVTANVINPTSYAFYLSLVSAKISGTINVSQVSGTTNINGINTSISGYFTGPSAILSFRNSSIFFYSATTLKWFIMSKSRSLFFCSNLICEKAFFYDTIDFYTEYAPMALNASVSILTDYDSYRALIGSGVALSTPAFTVDAPPVPSENVRYAGDNLGHFSNGSEEFPFATPALARADDANAVIKLVGYVENADVDTGTETVDEFPDTVGQSVTWEIVVSKGAAVQHATARTVWDAATNVIAALVTDTTVSIGTIDVTLSCDLVADQVRLRATATSDDWSVKVVGRVIS
jgi:hypothetical protein